MSESDGISETFDEHLRVALTAAAQVADAMARLHAENARRAAAENSEQARALRQRMTAEWGGARTELAQVDRPQFWDRASAEGIARTFSVARAWSDLQPEARVARETIREQVRTRYGVDVENGGADAATVAGYLARAAAAQQQAEAQRRAAREDEVAADQLRATPPREGPAADAERDDSARAGIDVDPADLHDVTERFETIIAGQGQRQSEAPTGREATLEEGQGAPAAQKSPAAHQEAALAYDSAERRRTMAVHLESKGLSQELIALRIRADIAQATPATEAVTGNAARTGRGGARGRGRARLEPGGIER
ncbi:hypothetical protein [Cellulomonas marina]|uniref:Colicin import membrane protein n=1 Tax=Cellulomonas marina TaxID=988821 RepID=A0A1I0YZL9_9CELL|nr:hypothetical protein [Cellulomonas marina]GIG28066.1 hypothetical protein Cma02nite_06660 [Cellulomonas marina]SFB17668.1 hypothetical protein SAMN05421867_1099 [Cellulomonas marina]